MERRLSRWAAAGQELIVDRRSTTGGRTSIAAAALQLIRQNQERIDRAKAAATAGESFLDGEATLQDVASPSGRCNWVLLRPDPATETLDLVGSGLEGMEELGGNMRMTAQHIGALRLEFKTKTGTVSKWAVIKDSEKLEEPDQVEEEGENEYTGLEVLEQINETGGAVDWALFKPDAADLQTVGYGDGGIEELKDSLGKAPMLYGMLRMEFMVNNQTETKWLFIKGFDENAGHNRIQRGKDMAKENSMQSAFDDVIGTISAEVQLTSTDDCTEEFAIGKLAGTVMADRYTLENYRAADAHDVAQKEANKKRAAEKKRAERERRREAAAKQTEMVARALKTIKDTIKEPVVELTLETAADCAPEVLIANWNKALSGPEAEDVTLENWQAAVAEIAETAEQDKERQAALAAMKTKQATVSVLESEAPPTLALAPETEEAMPLEEMVATMSASPPEPEPEPRQRKKMKVFTVGDQVEIKSERDKKWYLDGEIVEVTKESLKLHDLTITAGSMKVVYSQGKRYKWIPTHQLGQALRASPRPRPPDSKVGMLEKSGRQRMFFEGWNPVYVELNKGYMQWWASKAKATKGVAPDGKNFLLGLQVKRSNDSLDFQFRTDASKRFVHSFRCATAEECEEWVELVWAHAGYCDEAREFHSTLVKGGGVRAELMTVMEQKDSQRPNLAAQGDDAKAAVRVEVECS